MGLIADALAEYGFVPTLRHLRYRASAMEDL